MSGRVKYGNEELNMGVFPLYENEYRNLKLTETYITKGIRYNIGN
jgi:hypothetical protein